MKHSHIIALLILIIIGVALYYGTENVTQEEVVETSTETSAAEVTSEAEEETTDTESVTEVEEDNSVVEAAVEATVDTPVLESEVEATAAVREFTLDSFSFGYSQDTITVQQGDTVTINLTNSGGFHDWVVDEFDAATAKINEGETTSVTFVADQSGTFEYYCSVGSHRARGMVGTLIVE